MIDFTQAARADRTFRNGSREMIAWAGRCGGIAAWLRIRRSSRTPALVGTVRQAGRRLGPEHEGAAA